MNKSISLFVSSLLAASAMQATAFITITPSTRVIYKTEMIDGQPSTVATIVEKTPTGGGNFTIKEQRIELVPQAGGTFERRETQKTIVATPSTTPGEFDITTNTKTLTAESTAEGTPTEPVVEVDEPPVVETVPEASLPEATEAIEVDTDLGDPPIISPA